MDTYIIYSLSDPTTKQVRYIGQTKKDDRLEKHLLGCKNCTDKNLHKCRWINNLKYNYLDPIYKELLETTSEKVDNLEIELIKHYKQFSKLTNIADGGKGHSGKQTIEHINNVNATRGPRPDSRKKVIIKNTITGEELIFQHVNKAAEYLKVHPGTVYRNIVSKTHNKIKEVFMCSYWNKLNAKK